MQAPALQAGRHCRAGGVKPLQARLRRSRQRPPVARLAAMLRSCGRGCVWSGAESAAGGMAGETAAPPVHDTALAGLIEAYVGCCDLQKQLSEPDAEVHRCNLFFLSSSNDLMCTPIRSYLAPTLDAADARQEGRGFNDN